MPAASIFHEHNTHKVRSSLGDETTRIDVSAKMIRTDDFELSGGASQFLSAVKMHLQRSKGTFGSSFGTSSCRLLKDFESQCNVCVVRYFSKQNNVCSSYQDFDASCGLYAVINNSLMLNIDCSIKDKQFKNKQLITEYLVALVKFIHKSLSVENLISITKKHPIVIEDIDLPIYEFRSINRYEFEKNLVLNGKVDRSDCSIEFSDDDLENYYLCEGENHRTNYLSDELVAPDLDLDNLNQIEVPLPKKSDTPVEIEILKRQMDMESKIRNIIELN